MLKDPDFHLISNSWHYIKTLSYQLQANFYRKKKACLDAG